jgi:hypothetical protein
VPPFTWNLEEMRRAPLLGPKTIAAKRIGAKLSLDSAQWNGIAGEKLGPRSLGGPSPNRATEVKVAYDAAAIYVRFDAQLPDGWVKPPAAKRDDPRVPDGESFGLVLAPDNNPARYLRFAGGPDAAARYDARQGFIEDSIDPRVNQDDVSWNPDWEYACTVAADGKSWTALMVIPFSAIGAATPQAAAEWKVNFGRIHRLPAMPPEESLWSSNPDTASIGDRKAFGTLRFE